MNLKLLVQQSFNEAAEDCMNGERAIEMVLSKSYDGDVVIEFQVDCDRYGICDDNKVRFYKDGTVSVCLHDRIADGGIEEIMRDDLKSVILIGKDPLEDEWLEFLKETYNMTPFDSIKIKRVDINLIEELVAMRTEYIEQPKDSIIHKIYSPNMLEELKKYWIQNHSVITLKEYKKYKQS